MSQQPNTIDILKVLDKSNCGECRLATCLAFAAAVTNGQKKLTECPHLESDVVERFGEKPGKRKTVEEDLDETIEELRKAVAAMDLSLAAKRLGARFSGDHLTVKVCGKDCHVDARGNLSSEIHTHRWITAPILSYIAHGAGVPVSGNWVPLRELKSGKTWQRLFAQRCEKPLKKVADTYTDLFEDMLHIFNGKRVESHYQSDISIVLHPLPKLPILICYWKPEDELESDLNVFFDSSAESNLSIESIYALATGLVRMFEKIALTHGAD